MFRSMRRSKQQLSEADALAVLRRGTAGVLALHGDDGYPYAVPVSYAYAGGKLIFHGARTGHKADAIARDARASFCVTDRDEVLPAEYTTAYRSVIAFGRVRAAEDGEEYRAAALALAERYRPGYEAESLAAIEKAGSALRVYIMEIEHLTGKEGRALLSRRAAGEAL